MRNFIVALVVVVTVKVVARAAVEHIARKCFETQAPDS
jgi:hypothetical protein